MFLSVCNTICLTPYPTGGAGIVRRLCFDISGQCVGCQQSLCFPVVVQRDEPSPDGHPRNHSQWCTGEITLLSMLDQGQKKKEVCFRLHSLKI